MSSLKGIANEIENDCVELISRNKRKKLLRVLNKLKFEPASITEEEALGKILNILDTDFLRGK